MIATPLSSPAPIPGAFYQSPGDPPRLDVMAWEAGPREFHFYIAGASFADVAPILATPLKDTRALVYHMPAGLLNPNYWEPYTKAGEETVRASGTSPITRDDHGATWLWRSEGIAPGRYLRDGIDVPVERIAGAAFKVNGPDLLKLGKAWTSGGDAKDRFDWIAFRAPSGDMVLPLDSQEDLTSFRLHAPGAVMLFSATGDRQVRLVFTDRAPYRSCARAALRGYVSRCAGRTVSPPNDLVCDQFLGHSRRGLTSIPDPDFINKGTAFEFTARPNLTPWSQGWIGDSEPLEDRILVYYDRVAGIWAVAS